MAEDLAKILQEAKTPDLVRQPTKYCGNWSPDLDPPIPPAIPLAVDLETVRGTSRITQVNFAWCLHQAIASGWNPKIKAAAKEAIEQAGRELIFQNGQFDIPILEDNGISQPGGWIVFDTMIGAAILDPDMPNNLESIARDYTDIEPWKHMAATDLPTYGCIDADATYRIKVAEEEELKAEGVLGIFRTSMAVLPLLIEMERYGLVVGMSAAADKSAECAKTAAEASYRLDKVVAGLAHRRLKIDELTDKRDLTEEAARAATKKSDARRLFSEVKKINKDIYALEHVNWNSPQQLVSVMDELGIQRKTNKDTGQVTTDAATIQELARQTGNEVLKELLHFRRAKKLKSTYYDKAARIAGEDGRIHPRYLLHRDYDEDEGSNEGACSGRLASKGPNIQNWPKEARSIIIPDAPGWEWMEADYAQIEFRIMAWLVGGRMWEDVNRPGFDIHKTVASKAYGIRFEDVTDEQRYEGKRAVYAGVYAVGPLTLSRRFAANGIFISVADCKKLLSAFRGMYPEILRTQRKFVEEAFATNKVRNPFKRFRKFFKPDEEVTEIYNFYPQSTAGDIILRAMARLRQQLPRPARIAVQVHDSLLFGYPIEMRETVRECVLDVMTAVPPEMPGFKVPVDLKVGQSWGTVVGLKAA